MADIVWEYYASLSPYLPKGTIALREHQRGYWAQKLGISFPDDVATVGEQFFRSSSGLAYGTALDTHINTYFNNLDYSATWKDYIRTDALSLFGFGSFDRFSTASVNGSVTITASGNVPVSLTSTATRTGTGSISATGASSSPNKTSTASRTGTGTITATGSLGGGGGADTFTATFGANF